MRSFLRTVRVAWAWRADESGAALLETAIIIPVLVLLAIGVAEYGRVYLTGINVANAAMAGAEYGAQNSGMADAGLIRQRAQADAGDPTLTVNSNFPCRCPGSEAVVPCSNSCAGYGSPQFFIEVTASKNVSLVLRYPGLPSTISVSRMAAMRVQ